MTTWTLIIFLYAGAMSNSDSVALTNIGGFTSEITCENAGKTAVSKFTTLMKGGKFVCVRNN